MNNKTFNPIPYNYISVNELYKFFNTHGKVYIDTENPYDFSSYIIQNCPVNYKPVLINIKQQNELFERGFNRNGTEICKLDNLGEVYVQKYVHKTDNSITATTDIFNYVEPNEKYSFYIKDLIVNILSIADISFEKVGEIIKLTTGIDIPKERICEIYHANVRWKIYKDFGKYKTILENGIIQLNGVIHYDEQLFYGSNINHTFD